MSPKFLSKGQPDICAGHVYFCHSQYQIVTKDCPDSLGQIPKQVKSSLGMSFLLSTVQRQKRKQSQSRCWHLWRSWDWQTWSAMNWAQTPFPILLHYLRGWSKKFGSEVEPGKKREVARKCFKICSYFSLSYFVINWQ